jgi:pyrrolidone-carboxylate peptidase
MRVVVAGFGPFLDVTDNPAAAVVRDLSARAYPEDAEFVVMSVSYRRSIEEVAARVEAGPVDLVLGFGVARGREKPKLERVAVREAALNNPDVDGSFGADDMGEGPGWLESSLAEDLARCIGLEVSEDAGRYVCNRWLYRALLRGWPAAFIHIPSEGTDVDQVHAGLVRWMEESSARARAT